ncbi:MAG: hypothetical protein ACE5IL_08910 [Myxococcota bacterium]
MKLRPQDDGEAILTGLGELAIDVLEIEVLDLAQHGVEDEPEATCLLLGELIGTGAACVVDLRERGVGSQAREELGPGSRARMVAVGAHGRRVLPDLDRQIYERGHRGEGGDELSDVAEVLNRHWRRPLEAHSERDPSSRAIVLMGWLWECRPPRA